MASMHDLPSDENESRRMNAIVDPILCESHATYQENAQKHLTSHQLADFRRCPVLYRKKKLGLIAEEDRPAYLLGRALHTFVLEGQKVFEQQYAVGGPINPKTGQLYGSNTKAFAEWTAQQGKPVLTVQQHELVQRMAKGVRQQRLARELLSQGTAEGVVRAKYCQMPCQIRMDWFDPQRGIVDLKTCDDLDWFEADARRYGYVHQVAFYQGLLARVVGGFRRVHFIAVEKREPYRCGVWQIHDDALARARQENEAAIERLRQCILEDTWPTGYEDRRIFS